MRINLQGYRTCNERRNKKKQLVINEDGDVFTSQEEMESWEAWAGEMAAIGEASPDASEAEL